MDRNDIKTAIKKFLIDEILPGEKPESLTDQTKLFTDGILDSLGSLKMVSFLEERFKVKIEAHEILDQLETFDAIADLVIAKQG